MNFELVKRLKSPLKLNIELTGPSIGICDVPIKKKNLSSQVLPMKYLNKIIEKAIYFEILMFSFILSDLQHLFEPSIIKNLSSLCKRINHYGGLSALHIPINRNISLKEFRSYIAQKAMELEIDVLLFFIPKSALKIHGSEIGKLMLALALEGIHLLRLFTDLPSSKEEIEKVLIPSIKKIAETASIWKTFNWTFIINKKSSFDPSIMNFLEIHEEIDITFSFLPPIPSCIAQRFSPQPNFEIYKGVCPATYISSTIDVHGFPIPCLRMRKYNLPEIELLWKKWGEFEKSWLVKSEVCKICEFKTNCEGVCDLWQNIS